MVESLLSVAVATSLGGAFAACAGKFGAPSEPDDNACTADANLTDAAGGPCMPFDVVVSCSYAFHTPLNDAGTRLDLEAVDCSDPHLCGAGYDRCSIESTSPLTVHCADSCPVDGRRVDGMREPCVRAFRDRGLRLAESARFEAGSVVAFARLRRELHRLGAPRSILRRLSRAANDERRHARATARLARKYGAEPFAPSHEPPRPRSIEAIAVENAVEGIVGESFAAVMAAHQAAHALDPEVRAAMRTIAREEAEHAALSCALSTWLESRLDAAARTRVEAAKHAAIAKLLARVDGRGDVVLGIADGARSWSLAQAVFG